MKESFVRINNLNIPVYTLDALVIGSGCAGYNAADWLYDLGVTDVAIVTEDKNCGTSRNTGSDKQTYYKLSLSSSETDSVGEMAQTLFEGKSVNGDIAYAEAACSVKSFMKLVNLGVPFPTNEYGEYVGYMTDHDTHRRATSAGPLTSKYMTEALEKSVEKKNIKIFNKILIAKLITKDNHIIGALGIDKTSLFNKNRGLVIFESNYIVMATGGPAGIYKNSVYPNCHKGMTSLAIEAGATCANLQEWQYGLASVDFRWNVSGTYQQVIPRYISKDEEGNEYEFLNDYFKNPYDALNMVFKKGYQWPFDSMKIEGSSVVDLIIHNETVNKKRKVYMDFTREPTALENGFECLCDEAYTYLENSDALINSPIKRLEKMNPKAILLYKSHGIDLYSEPLQVNVCAQHNNGGVMVDSNWQSSIKGLYVAGEAAGTFGVYRPGGSALNSTQVGSMRAAESIAVSIKQNPAFTSHTKDDLINPCMDILSYVSTMKEGTKPICELSDIRESYAVEMSSVASHIRIPSKMKELSEKVHTQAKEVLKKTTGCDIINLPDVIRLKDMLLTQSAVLSAMQCAASSVGSRGGAVVSERELTEDEIFKLRSGDSSSHDGKIFVTVFENDSFSTGTRDVKAIPQPDLWFENVWNSYNKKWGIN